MRIETLGSQEHILALCETFTLVWSLHPLERAYKYSFLGQDILHIKIMGMERVVEYML